MVSKFEILQEMDKFLEICDLPKLTWEINRKTYMSYHCKVKFSVKKSLSPDGYTGEFYQHLMRY